MSFDRPPSATTSSAPFRRIVKRAATVVAATAAVLTVIFVVLAVAAGALLAAFANYGHRERKHLAPIPIAASACPYVALMHEAANRFQTTYPVLGLSYDADMHELAWPQTRDRLRHATDVLDFSIVAGTPHFPQQVQHYLDVTLVNLRTGRAQLAAASNASDVFSRTQQLFQDGQAAFGFAGDLIGRQCPVPLAADSDTMPYPFRTTSPTSPPSPAGP
jgi:hypothetical protein